MKKAIQTALACLIFWGCTNNSKSASDLSANNFTQRFSIKNCMIPLDSLTLNIYERGITTFHSDSACYFAAYNRYTHSIDWFDMANETIYHRTVLDKIGPNEITEQVEGIYIHTFDTIFLNDRIYLYMINKDGEVKHKIQNYFETEMGPAYMVNKMTSALQFLPSKNSLISEALIPGKQEVFFLELDLMNETHYLHQVKISDCYTLLNGQRNFINVSFKGDSIIYNSSCSSEIFVYDFGNKQTSIFDGESSLSRNSIPHINTDNPEALWRHIIENPRFFGVIHSPADDLYYRLHWKEAVFQSDQDPNTIAYDKPVVLSVFSEDFQVLFETILPGHQYLVDFLLPAPQGVVVNANNPENSTYDINKNQLHILKFENLPPYKK